MGKIPFRFSLKSATLVPQPFSRRDWVFEENSDEVWILAYKEGLNVSWCGGGDRWRQR
jgi:hypothetical protein